MATENKIQVSLFKDELQSLIETSETSSYCGRVKFSIQPHELNNSYNHCRLYTVTFDTDNIDLLEVHATSFIFASGVHHGKKSQ